MQPCDHFTIGAPDVLEFFPCCHTYKRGDKFLTSVSSVLRVWPDKPSWDGIDPAILENARMRGIEVDSLLCSWLSGDLEAIPAGTRQDSADLFEKIAPWWRRYFGWLGVRTQVILDDGEVAGTADLVVMTPSAIYDLKCVSELQVTYPFQVGAYCHLFEARYGRLPEKCGVIHMKKNFKEPKLVEYAPSVVASEFRTILEMWKLVQRKKG